MTDAEREVHHRWLLELTQTPTVAGREGRVVRWIERWAAERPGAELTRDAAGNLHVSMRPARPTRPPPAPRVAGDAAGPSGGPLYFTAHLDHPAFVVERITGPSTVELSFRGGVMADYFKDARVAIHTGPAEGDAESRNERERAAGSGREGVITATLTGHAEGSSPPFERYIARLDPGARADALAAGDIATWDLPPAEISGGILHTAACDDLAAAAAALAAFDVLLQDRSDSGRNGPLDPSTRPADLGPPDPDVRLLFTRAEEVGFIGAIAACRAGTMPRGSRILALENSRSFDDSPIGGGPIVRVGDRLSIFSPGLTAAVAKRAEEIAGGPPPTASQKLADAPKWKWQRKLMAGGACEATVFCAFGYDATCLCLPLGNYHNMADLAAVQAGTNTTPPKVGREFISLADFDGLVDLLVACGRSLPESAGPGMIERLDRLWETSAFVLRP